MVGTIFASIVLPLVIVDAHVPVDGGVNVEGFFDGGVIEE